MDGSDPMAASDDTTESRTREESAFKDCEIDLGAVVEWKNRGQPATVTGPPDEVGTRLVVTEVMTAEAEARRQDENGVKTSDGWVVDGCVGETCWTDESSERNSIEMSEHAVSAD